MAPDAFCLAAQRILHEREVQTVCVIEQVVAQYERERRVSVVSYEDYRQAMRRSASGRRLAPVDRHWYEAWRKVREATQR